MLSISHPKKCPQGFLHVEIATHSLASSYSKVSAEEQSGSLKASEGIRGLLLTPKLRMSFFGLKRSLLRLGSSAVLCPSQRPTQMVPVLSQIARGIYILGMNHFSGGDQVSQNLLKNTEGVS